MPKHEFSKCMWLKKWANSVVFLPHQVEFSLEQNVWVIPHEGVDKIRAELSGMNGEGTLGRVGDTQLSSVRFIETPMLWNSSEMSDTYWGRWWKIKAKLFELNLVHSALCSRQVEQSSTRYAVMCLRMSANVDFAPVTFNKKNKLHQLNCKALASSGQSVQPLTEDRLELLQRHQDWAK